MFVVLCYDAAMRNDSKLRKTVIRYLCPVQKLVFEGYISERKLKKMKQEIACLVDITTDAVVIYSIPSTECIEKQQLGLCISPENNPIEG